MNASPAHRAAELLTNMPVAAREQLFESARSLEHQVSAIVGTRARRFMLVSVLGTVIDMLHKEIGVANTQVLLSHFSELGQWGGTTFRNTLRLSQAEINRVIARTQPDEDSND